MPTVQVLCQNCDSFVPALISYYATPDVIVTGQFSIGRPVSESDARNVKRDETKIHTQAQDLRFLRDSDIQGVLVVEPDSELELIMGTDLDPEKVYLFGVNERSLEARWWTERPSFEAQAWVSLRKGVREIVGERRSIF